MTSDIGAGVGGRHLRQAAMVVTVLGHPLVTTTAFILLVAMRNSAISMSGGVALIATVVLPLGLWNLRQTRSGRYANFDVSVRTERTSMYTVLLVLMAIATSIVWVRSTAPEFRAGMTCLLGMFAAARAANAWLKVSLHAATSIFLSMAAGLMVGPWGTAGLLAASCLIAGSRLILRRHKFVEVVCGAALGLSAGALFLVLVPATRQ